MLDDKGNPFDITEIRWYDLYFGLSKAVREGRAGYEGHAQVQWYEWPTGKHAGVAPRVCRFAFVSCDDVRAELARRTAKNRADLKGYSTRQLMAFLNHARACGGWYSPCDDRDYDHGWSYEMLKDELATREHIPNKKEAKAMRQQAARLARSSKRS